MCCLEGCITSCYPVPAKQRPGLQLRSKNTVSNGQTNPLGYAPWVSALVDAGGVALLLSYAPLLVPLLGPSARPTHLKPGS